MKILFNMNVAYNLLDLVRWQVVCNIYVIQHPQAANTFWFYSNNNQYLNVGVFIVSIFIICDLHFLSTVPGYQLNSEELKPQKRNVL